MSQTAWENGQRVPIVEFHAPSFDVPIMRRDAIGFAPQPQIAIDHAVFQRLTHWVAQARTRREFSNRRLAVEWVAWPSQSQAKFASEKGVHPGRLGAAVKRLKASFAVK